MVNGPSTRAEVIEVLSPHLPASLTLEQRETASLREAPGAEQGGQPPQEDEVAGRDQEPADRGQARLGGHVTAGRFTCAYGWFTCARERAA